MPTKKIYSVTELNNKVKNLLEDNFSSVWVEGEISRFTHHSSGHMYFTLKDKNCALDAVMFRGANMTLEFKPDRGIKVLLKGHLSLFPPQGRYQLIVKEMKEKGAGELEEKFRKLKKRLHSEGLFDKKHKKKIPAVPRIVGIVTSPTGAAVRDILNVISRRFSGLKIVLFPSRVQGELAAGEIVKGIKVLNDKYPDMDAMIIGRGGGSLEDLWPFNEESAARAVFNSKIPVISAVGHEIDFSITDFTADLRAPTPSAAAELIAENKAELIRRVKKLGRSMRHSLKNRLRMLERAFRSASASAVFIRPYRIIEDRYQQLDHLTRQLNTTITHGIEIRQHRLNSLEGKISSLSPQHTLARGYTITYKMPEKNLIRKAAEAKRGEKIKTVFAKGEIISEVIEKQEGNNE